MLCDVDSILSVLLKTDNSNNLSNHLINLSDGFRHFDRVLFNYANKLVDINIDNSVLVFNITLQELNQIH